MTEPFLDFDLLDATIKREGYYILKNAQTIALCEAARAEYFAAFPKLPLRAGAFTYAESQANLIRKKNISSANGVGEAYAQVMQTLYYPKEHSHSGASALFEYIIQLRNQLTGEREDFGDDPVNDQFWNARRIHHYPRGGGFMVRHKDTYFPKALGERGFLQILVLLSKKGEDFETGGGHMLNLKNEFIDLEDPSIGGFGSIVFFDGRIPHGVTDVDPNAPFSFDAVDGRLSAVANLYQYRGN